MNKATVDELLQFSSLSSFHREDMEGLANYLQRMHYAPDEKLCKEGEVEDTCYFLLEGAVQITKQVNEETRVKLATLESGELVGLAGMIPEQARTAGVHAKTEVIAFILSRQDLEAALLRAESWAFHMFRLVSSQLASQLRSALSKLDEMETTLLPGRNIEKSFSGGQPLSK